jgi:hypothetical protein
MQLLDSPHQVEREAAQTALSEFRFDRYLAAFDDLSRDARRVTGVLVKQIDAATLPALRLELSAASRSRRKRGLELCLALDAVAETAEEIAGLLRDDDQFLRIDAIRVLATCDSPTTRQTLRDALVDSHPLVQEAAEIELTRLLQRAGARVLNEAPASPAAQTQALASKLTDTVSLFPVASSNIATREPAAATH